ENMLNGFALHEMIFDDDGRPADYRFLEVNATFETMTGFDRAAAVGKTVRELLPGLEPEWVETYGQVTLTGEPARFEQYSASLGRWFSVLAFSPQRGQFATVVEDITDRRRAEEALAAINARLQAVISASPVAIYMLDQERGVQLWNPAAERLFGWTEEEVLGLPRPPIVRPEAEEEVARVTRGLLEGRALHAYETVRPHRDGTLIPVSISAAPLFGADGDVSGWVTVIADLRERVRAEREAEERVALDKLVLVTHGLLQETTPEGLLQRAVDGACELAEAEMGCTGHDYTDDRFRLTAIARAASTRSWPEAADLSVEHGGLCLELLHSDAALRLTDEELRQHPAYASLPPEHATLCGLLGVSLTDPAGRPVGVLAVSCRREGEFTARDESLLQQLATFASLALARLEALRELELQARALSASNKELEAFSYSVSHDLRAPLRAMDGFSRALLEDYADALDEQGRHYLDRVRGASQRMGELIDDLLQLSRVTRDPMRWEDVDLSALARDIIAQLYAAERGRAVAATVQDGLSAQGHPALLRALLLNLLGNAWKFTTRRADAQIEFGASERDGETVYFVRDNGAGFDMHYVDKLFTPFQRLHAQEEFPGNGVGLATVQRVVNRHGGRAWAEGAVDQGATFYFTLGE
ncbi:MAG: PAS domain S-box protein, partial [Armatimonadetes bacterium]|nr:PAS domain S-box protein [Armatimonadota bacterium]